MARVLALFPSFHGFYLVGRKAQLDHLYTQLDLLLALVFLEIFTGEAAKRFILMVSGGHKLGK